MNILYHHRTQGRGVEAVHILGIVRAWQKLGHTVDILSPPGVTVSAKAGQTRKPSSLSRILKYFSRCVPELLFEVMELFYNFYTIKSFQSASNQKKYDFVFERYALLAWAGLWCARKRNIPFILEVNYTSYTPLFRKRSRILKPLAHLIDKYLFSKADCLVAVSTYLRQRLIDLGVDPKKIIVLPNAADPDLFLWDKDNSYLKEKLNLLDKKVVGFVGFFYPWHGLRFLFDVMDDIFDKTPSTVFMFIGDGPERTGFEEGIKTKKYKEQVLFLGRMGHDSLMDYISLFDIALVPHSNNYGSPMKIYEYMAMGKPVVAPRLGPLEDGITQGVEGILFEPQNQESLKSSIAKLLNDSKLCREMGISARKKIEDVHNWNKNAESILEAYQQKKSEL